MALAVEKGEGRAMSDSTSPRPSSSPTTPPSRSLSTHARRLLEVLRYAFASDTGIAPGVASLLYNRVLGDAASATAVISFLKGATGGSYDEGLSAQLDATNANRSALKPPGECGTGSGSGSAGPPLDVRLFSWELSYFSGKVRAYLRFKARGEDRLRFEDINADPELIQTLLLPATRTNVVPQVQVRSRRRRGARRGSPASPCVL